MRQVFSGFSATIVTVFLLWLVAAQLAPAQWWLDVRSVVVANAKAGEQPTMNVDRSIYQRFPGTYTVDVEKRMPSGRYSVVCSVRNSTNYRPDAELPDPLLLDWWTWPAICKLGPGRHRVETTWRIEAPLFPDKVLTVMSNTFEVTR